MSRHCSLLIELYKSEVAASIYNWTTVDSSWLTMVVDVLTTMVKASLINDVTVHSNSLFH